MPALIDGKVTYQSNEALPALGSQEYQNAQSITLDSLKPVSPVVVPSPTTSAPSSSGINVSPPAGTNTNSDGSIVPTQRQQTAKDILAQQGILDTEGTVKSQLETDNQVQAKKDAATSSYNAYNQAKLDLQQKLESMVHQSGGSTAGNSQAIQNAQREGNANLANLALKAQVDQGLYSDAQATVTSKLNDQFAPVRAKIDAMYKYAQFNDNDPQVLAAAKKKEADANNVQDVSTNLHKALLDNGKADSSILSAMDSVNNDFIAGKITAQEAQNKLYQAVGSAGGDQLKQLQIQKAKVDLAKANIDLNNAQPGSGNLGLTTDYSGFLQSRTPTQILQFNSLPDTDKGVVAQLVNGDALLSDIVKSRGASGTADIKKYIQEATAIDPTFSVNNNKVRYSFMQNWNNPNGKSSTTRNALNTALGHLADFKTNADTLTPGEVKGMNSVQNILSTQTGSPNVLRLRTDINALASEIATAYKGSQPTEGEIKNWEETIAADFSKSQFQGVSDELTKLLSSKITASRYQFKNTMGYEYGQSIIDPDKRQALLDAGISSKMFPFENTGNPQDNPFGQSIGGSSLGGSSPYYNASTGTFTIPK